MGWARFRRTRHGIEVRLAKGEADVLLSLARSLVELLSADDASPSGPRDPLEALVGLPSAPAEKPTDPILARLLPDAYGSDDEAADEFRRLTENDLRAGKMAGARGVVADVEGSADGRVRLDLAGAERWLPVLTDMRLALGTQLGVTEDLDIVSEVAKGDERAGALVAYDWLGYLQETLVEAVS